MSQLDDLVNDLKRHEGFRSKVYQDSVGIWTIGYGRNLQDVGVSRAEAELMLFNDALEAQRRATELVSNWGALDFIRQNVLSNMVFNMGLMRVKGFKKMLAAVEAMDWNEAADQMLASTWAAQVGARAQELAGRMRTGTA